MTRIAHVISPDADEESRRSVELLSQQLGAGFSLMTRTIVRGGDWSNVPAAVLGLRRELSSDLLVHAWGSAALMAAILSGAARIIFSPGSVVSKSLPRWLRAVMSHRDVDVISPTATLRKALVTRGVPLERCHLIRPGVEFGRVRSRRDPQLRAALGLNHNDYCILAAGESTRNAAHRDAIWTTSILHVLEERYKLLLWGRGSNIEQTMRFASRFEKPGVVINARQSLANEIDFESLLPAADLVLVTAHRQVATLPIMTAMAAGLPIVSSVTYTISELLEDRHNALMVGNATPRLLAQRILDLQEDPGLQWSISDRARTDAYEYFSATRFLNQYRALYRQIAAGEKVEIPEAMPGAGSKFVGRA